MGVQICQGTRSTTHTLTQNCTHSRTPVITRSVPPVQHRQARRSELVKLLCTSSPSSLAITVGTSTSAKATSCNLCSRARKLANQQSDARTSWCCDIDHASDGSCMQICQLSQEAKGSRRLRTEYLQIRFQGSYSQRITPQMLHC